MSLLLLLACGRPGQQQADDPHHYAEALAAIAADPTATAAACAAISATRLRDDCLAAGAEALAPASPDKARAACADISGALLADECHFMVAERLREPTLCDKAGRFRDDCRLHLLQQTTAAAKPAAPDDPALAALIARSGFEDDDPRALTLVFRHALGARAPLDLSGCERSISEEWCVRAGEGLLNDRLNHARDTGAISEAWCSGERDSVPSLRYTPHPALDATVARRSDLCP